MSEGSDKGPKDFEREVEAAVEHEANVILVTGVLCVMVAVLGFLAAANSFTLSKKHFYYHHANQLFNLVQVLVSAALLITSAVLSKY